ncbi:long-chain-fatty-acid--CoA ligase ACSBG2-like isoform X2 [Dreissena polymorpha]|nr:long-chain-fatty-acid--CoA ligase ACSBG2-like isoform X2 [Dreissena polymorpha]XP_052277988.1 long-chain-fatty-acid--CoA ligase ACSBG2-like isoform X2 [Dreissena polymorpha]
MGNNASGPAVSITQIRTLVNDSNTVTTEKKTLDDLLPATSYCTTDITAPVKLRLEKEGHASIKPITMETMFRQTAEKLPDTIALGVKRNGVWQKTTFREYYSLTKQAARAFIKVGLEPRHAVSVLGFNSPEWFISYLGAIFAGGVGTGIYATNSPEACAFVLQDSCSNVVVVENHAQLQKILQVWDSLPHLKAIVQYTGEVAERRDNIYSWDEFLALGNDVPDSALEERLSIQAPNACCSIIYTSGTTGNPKGVMLSHDNYTWTADMVCKQLKLNFGKEIGISFLPLSHIAAQMLDFICPVRCGGSVYFAQPDALKGTLLDSWKEVRPTFVFAVPRLWEKINERLVTEGAKRPKMARKISAWARDKGLKASKGDKPWGWSLANVLVFKKLRNLLGLDRCRLFGSGAAPIMKETLEFFNSLNICIYEVYGMSECTGPQTMCSDGAYRITSVGKEMMGVKTKFENPDEDGNGEVCFWGRHVFMGYLNDEVKTKECLGDNMWIHSGDIGKKDEDGFLYITGRIKELVITAGGENIAPVPVESAVKEALPCVSNCMLIGDKRKFLSMLITLKTEMNLDTNEPLDSLAPETLSWYRALGSQAKTVEDAIADKNVLQAVQVGIDKANKKAVSNASKVQKWTILPKDFSMPGGELGPTLKLKRPVVAKMYDKTISAFYEE